MVKLKKFFLCLILLVFTTVTILPMTACKKDDLNKVSKNLTCYSIDAVVGDNYTVSATEKINYYNNTGESLNNLCFHLYPRAFRKDASFKPYTSLTLDSCFPNGISYGDIEILKVEVDGTSQDITLVGLDEDILKVNLSEELKQKERVEVMVEFSLVLPNCTHRFGYYDKNINLANWYPIVCFYENGEFDMSPYYSTGDPFCSDIANYEVTIKYPKKYLIASTGNISTTSDNDDLISNMSAKAVRDYAINLSEDTAVISKNVGDTLVSYVGYKSDEKFQKYLDISAKAVSYFSKTFGEYPYSTLMVVKMPFIYGGMEYPNIVFVSDSIDDEDEILKVIVHEIAHQWWYAVVGNNEVNEAWLDESLTEYSTALFFKNNDYGIVYEDLIKDAISSYALYVDVIKTIRGEVNTKMNLAVNQYQNDYEYSYMVYIKGIIMFDDLKNAVGENRLINGLKKYYQNNKFKIATKDDFYKAFNQACHKDLVGYFEGYLNGTTIIANIN